jgi:hypothetical protein
MATGIKPFLKPNSIGANDAASSQKKGPEIGRAVKEAGNQAFSATASINAANVEKGVSLFLNSNLLQEPKKMLCEIFEGLSASFKEDPGRHAELINKFKKRWP